MKTIDVGNGRVRICYGIDSPTALIEVRPPLFGSPALMREVGWALLVAAADIEGALPGLVERGRTADRQSACCRCSASADARGHDDR